ncbi:MAG: sigma 54-interacting transcriptional regulator [Kiritimatiellia bacterium]
MKPTSTDAILESISDGVFTVDRNWLVTSFNRSAEKITGISRDEAIGRLCSDVFRCSLCGDDCALKQTLESDRPIIGKSAFFITSEGERRPVSISTAVLRDENGEIIGGAETFRDLSEVEALHQEIEERYSLGDLVSHSPRMRRLFEILPAVAASPSNVLILGETGTGKEVMARAVHQHSSRNEGPFVAVNCGALPDSLLESELFGYKAGAFTGAAKDKPGRFSLARGGTLFLDEIGEISPALQVRLLRVLQESTFEPLGSVETETTDARIIFSTNRDLTEMVKQGEFREDLYYRINIARLELPPLRERKEDIPVLINRFIDKFNALMRKNIHGIAPEALSLLIAHDWPGNIRELENSIERAFIVCNSDLIGISHLPSELGKTDGYKSAVPEMKSAHRILDVQTIQAALENNNYNRLAAARELGIHKTTLFRKIKKLGIVLPEQDGRSS